MEPMRLYRCKHTISSTAATTCRHRNFASWPISYTIKHGKEPPLPRSLHPTQPLRTSCLQRLSPCGLNLEASRNLVPLAELHGSVLSCLQIQGLHIVVVLIQVSTRLMSLLLQLSSPRLLHSGYVPISRLEVLI